MSEEKEQVLADAALGDGDLVLIFKGDGKVQAMGLPDGPDVPATWRPVLTFLARLDAEPEFEAEMVAWLTEHLDQVMEHPMFSQFFRRPEYRH